MADASPTLNDPELAAVLMGDPRLAPVLSDPAAYRAQVLVSDLLPPPAGRPVTSPGNKSSPGNNADGATGEAEEAAGRGAGGGGSTRRSMYVARSFRAGAEYFYPASTVKLVGAAAACVSMQVMARAAAEGFDRFDAHQDGWFGGPRRLTRFRLDLDTPLLFEHRGLVASIADYRARKDVALENRARMITLAEARLDAMERREGVAADAARDEAAGTFKRRRGDEEDDELVAAARSAAAVVVDEETTAAIAADMDTFVDELGESQMGIERETLVTAYVASRISDDEVSVYNGGSKFLPGDVVPPQLRNLKPTTLATELRKLFLVSDNEAFNRCYDLAGPAGINAWADGRPPPHVILIDEDLDFDDDLRVENRGDHAFVVRHRLFTSATDADNPAYLPAVWANVRVTNVCGDIVDEESELQWVRLLPARRDPTVEDPRHPKRAPDRRRRRKRTKEDEKKQGKDEEERRVCGIGTAHITPAGVKVDAPLDCSTRNRATLDSLQAALVRIARPDLAPVADADAKHEPSEARGKPEPLSEPHRQLLLEVMSGYPRDSNDTAYDPGVYPDHYGKLFLRGLTRVVPQASLVVANKLGRAYGFSVDNAYVSDAKTGRGFFLAASVETNANGVVNDDVYEYESVADPFMENLAETIARWMFGKSDRAVGGEEAAELEQLRKIVGSEVSEDILKKLVKWKHNE